MTIMDLAVQHLGTHDVPDYEAAEILAHFSCAGGRDIDWQAIAPRLDLFNHSPAGLDWGYGGSGPAQTALAILADFLEDDAKAVRLHQTFKFALIGGLPVEGGEITGATILEFVRVVEAQAEAAAARK